MNTENAIVIARAVERMAVLLVAFATIWMGYQLFSIIPWQEASSGEVQLPGGIGAKVTSVGSGVLFALIGVAAMISCLWRPIDFEGEVEPDGTRKTRVRGMADTRRVAPPVSHGGAGVSAIGVASAFEKLNWVTDTCGELADDAKRAQANIGIRDAKLALMQAVWNEDRWGPFHEFRDWVINESAGGRTAPDMLAEPAELFFKEGRP